MKKSKRFFMTLLVALILLGFSGTSSAFDLSSITDKPVEFVKYVAKKLGFGDDDDIKSTDSEPENKTLAANETVESPYTSENKSKLYDSLNTGFDDEIFNAEYLKSSNDGLAQAFSLYGWQYLGDEANFNLVGENWNFRVVSKSGEIIAPFDFLNRKDRSAFESAIVPVWMTRMDYQANLPWESIPQLNVEFFLKSAFYSQYSFGSNDLSFEGIGDTSNLSPDIFGYGFSVSAPFNNSVLSLHGWYGEQSFSPTLSSLDDLRNNADLWLQMLDSGYYRGNNNLAAALSYKLPFMSFFHQGLSPTLRLETAYSFGSARSDFGGIENYDQWKVGMAYEGTNRVNLRNSSIGINWGVGYNYTVVTDDLNLENLGETYEAHSGNVYANTYWNNLKIYTMFMYLYDRETRESMTMLNATLSSGWRWSYGIRANFYYGNKDRDNDALSNKEQVSFTATYRWD